MTVRPLGNVYFTYLISGSFCALAAFCALASEPAQATTSKRTKDRRIRPKRFTGVLHSPADSTSGFRQDNLSLQEGGTIGKRAASRLDASNRRRWVLGEEAEFIFCEDVTAGSRDHQQVQRAKNALEMAKICDKAVAFHSSDFMIARQTRENLHKSKSRLRRRRIDRDSSPRLDRRCLRTSPRNLFHRHIFEMVIEMQNSRRWPEMRAPPILPRSANPIARSPVRSQFEFLSVARQASRAIKQERMSTESHLR